MPEVVALPVTARVLAPKDQVPLPDKVMPLTVVKVGVEEMPKEIVPPEPKVKVPPPVRLVEVEMVSWVLPWTAVPAVEP